MSTSVVMGVLLKFSIIGGERLYVLISILILVLISMLIVYVSFFDILL